jgi:hypothetical protein
MPSSSQRAAGSPVKPPHLGTLPLPNAALAGDTPAPFLQSSGLAPTPSGLANPPPLPAAGTPTTAGGYSASVARTHSLTLGTQLPDLQNFWDYLFAEANPQEKVPTTDVVWRQTERDRV